MTITVAGCKVPSQLQMQLNVGNPDYDDTTQQYGSGRYCKLVTLTPDGEGNMTARVELTDLVQDCWQSNSPTLDPSTKLVASMQAQINASALATTYDFCINNWTIE